MPSEPTIIAKSVSAAASPAEAAAISAAIRRFQADTAVAPSPHADEMDPWTRAALTEGVSAKATFGRSDPDGIF